MGKLVNKKELEELLGKSHETLTQWQRDGMPIERHGENGQSNEYDTAKVIGWWFDRETKKSTSLENERAELTRLQQQQMRVKLAKDAGELVLASEIEATWLALVSAARAHALQLPGKLAAELEITIGEDAKRAVLDKALRDFLTKLSDYEPKPSTDHSGGEVLPASGGVDGGPVGGQVSAPLFEERESGAV